jgi:uncharacterized protein (DUF433 family)
LGRGAARPLAPPAAAALVPGTIVRRVRMTAGPISRKLEPEGGPSMAALDWSECPAVESVPGKVSGAWVLRGTRMPVATIFENLEAGASIDDLLNWYEGLDRKQVQAVIEFAARSLDLTPTKR